MSGPLQGMRVLEVTQALAGPYCGMLLADMGAEVIKVEDPVRGAAARGFGTVFYQGGVNANFMAANRNKKSLVLNLKHPRGKEIFLELVKRSHVVLENNRPGVMDRLGLSWDVLKNTNPGIIFASISGFGQTGPYRERGGYDIIAQGMSGIMSVTGEPGRPPAKAGVPVTDIGAALYCCYGILSAYVHFLRTGEGQRVDTSLFEAGIAFSVWEATEYWATGRIPGPLGSAHRMNAPYQAFKTADGYITIGGNNAKLWHLICQVLGRPELEHDERFATKTARVENRDELVKIIEEITSQKPSAYWLKQLERVGVPAGPIYTYDQVFEDPQTIARQMVQTYEHPRAGTLRALGIPVKLDKTPGVPARAGAEFGQHTDEVLQSIGLTDEDLKSLEAEGLIVRGPSTASSSVT